MKMANFHKHKELVIFAEGLFLLAVFSRIEANFVPEFSPKESIVITRIAEGPGTPIGSIVHRFRGLDRDGDTLTFTVDAENSDKYEHIFRFDRASKSDANLVLKRELDRETESEYIFEMLLSDGRSTLPAKQTFMLIVVDVNDNSPVFESYQKTISVPENSPVPAVICEMNATDEDEGQNGNVTYNLEMDEEDMSIFNLSMNEEGQAVITLLKPLDYEKRSKYKIRVVAHDNPLKSGERREAVAVVTLLVADEDDTGPVFVSSPSYIKLREDSPIGTEVCKVKALDGDTGLNRGIIYELINEHDNFQVDPATGTVTTKRHLDRGQTTDGTFTLHIRAVEEESSKDQNSSTQTIIVISLIGVKDKPKFRNQSYEGWIAENSGVGMPVAMSPGYIPEAYDNDLGENGLIRLRVEGDGGTFTVIPSQGFTKIPFQVVVKNPLRLDYERLQEIVFHLIAEDVSRNRSIAIISVRITDVNDNAPEFSQLEYSAKIPENPVVGLNVLTLKATDKDSGMFGTHGIRYTNLIGFASEKLELDPISGRISVKAEDTIVFDREINSFLYVMAEARDYFGQGNRNMTTIVIELEDMNDHAPTFSQSSYETEVYENRKDFFLAVKVSAVDADLKGTNNSELRYSLSNKGDKQTTKLEINEKTGEIHVKDGFDYEILGGSRRGEPFPVNFSVQAHDLGLPRQMSSVNLTLWILDENDCAPQFRSLNYEKSIPENVKENEIILKVEAKDGDISTTFNRIMYKIIDRGFSNEKTFTINSVSGELSLVPGAEVDYNIKSEYSLEIGVSDWLGLQSNENAVVNIILKDVNNKPPHFIFNEENNTSQCQLKAPTFHAQIRENLGENETITRLTAEDPDQSALLRYSIDFGGMLAFKNGSRVELNEGHRYIQMNNSTGFVTVGKLTFDYELFDELKVPVVVEDMNAEVEGPQKDTAYLFINIKNVVDKAPTFSSTSYLASISENVKQGTVVQKVTASVDDAGDKRSTDSIKYLIVPHSPSEVPFDIDAKSGEIHVSGDIDREASDWRNFSVEATCANNGKLLSSRAHVFVRIEDENDNSPVFLDFMDEVALKENSPKGTMVAKVHAEDKDSGRFGKVAYFLENGSNVFEIDSNSGVITLMGEVDREKFDLYELTIEAWDDCNSSTRSSCKNSKHSVKKLSVRILDENDEIPKIEMISPCLDEQIGCYDMTDNEGISFRVSDDYQPNTGNSMVSVTLESECKNGVFHLIPNEDNAWKIVAKSESFDSQDNCTLVIKANDHGNPVNVIEKEVKICGNHIVSLPSKSSVLKSDDENYFEEKNPQRVVISPGYNSGMKLLQLTNANPYVSCSIKSPIKLYLSSGNHHDFLKIDNHLFLIDSKGLLVLNFDVPQNVQGYFKVNVDCPVNSGENLVITVIVYIVQQSQKINLPTQLQTEVALRQMTSVKAGLEALFHLDVNIDLLSREENLNEFVVCFISTANNQILDSSLSLKLFKSRREDVLNLQRRFQILNILSGSSLTVARPWGQFEDRKASYLFFAGSITCLLATLVLIWTMTWTADLYTSQVQYEEVIICNDDPLDLCQEFYVAFTDHTRLESFDC